MSPSSLAAEQNSDGAVNGSQCLPAGLTHNNVSSRALSASGETADAYAPANTITSAPLAPDALNATDLLLIRALISQSRAVTKGYSSSDDRAVLAALADLAGERFRVPAEPRALLAEVAA